MKRRSRNYILIKTLRVAGWCLLVLLFGFLLSGYAMTGRFRLGRVFSAQEGKDLHLLLHVPLLVAAVAHVVPAVYFAWLRWFKKRRRS
ncbi:MAG: hypothetical protein N3B01_00990 [Verrucomicrobiae bacterium]|nr:hypothetical protein [Verrucomicrobiae bacterium]